MLNTYPEVENQCNIKREAKIQKGLTLLKIQSTIFYIYYEYLSALSNILTDLFDFLAI